MGHRRELMIAILVLAAGWVALMVVLAKLQGGREAEKAPTFPHYPGTESVKEQTVPGLGSRKYWFTLNQDYPSTAVYQFYRGELQPQGWRRLGPEPTWRRKEEKEQVRDLFQTMWLSADRIYQMELQMASTVEVSRKGDKIVSEKRKPGIEVYVTLRRAMGPWLLESDGRGRPAPDAIELKETDR